jgi:hypothetical protein
MTMYPYNAHNMTMVIPVSKFADLHVKIKSMEEENARLKAEVERLTKAGDELSWAYHALFRNTLCDGWYRRFMSLQECKVKEVEAWNAAKEGKQP